MNATDTRPDGLCNEEMAANAITLHDVSKRDASSY